MEKLQVLDVLKRCEDLKDINKEDLLSLMKVGEIEVYRKGEEIFTINHKGENFFVVLEGRLLLRLKNNKGKEYIKSQLFGEVAILGNTYRFGTVRAVEESMLLVFNRNKLFNSKILSKDLVLKLVLALTKKIVAYFDEDILISSKESIKKGENDFIEFKGSISKVHRSSIVRALVAFMNLNGGTIFCGVEDDNGKIVGLKNTLKEIDEFKKMILGEARRKIGFVITKYISFDIEEIDGKNILRIDCDSSQTPVFYKEVNNTTGEEKELFIVRTGPQNMKMKKTRDVINYVQERYRN
ncbi:MAG: RNA-binding domain-containing protein [Saprospiraceae bacterium]